MTVFFRTRLGKTWGSDFKKDFDKGVFLWNTFVTYTYIFFIISSIIFAGSCFFAVLLVLHFSWRWCKFIFIQRIFSQNRKLLHDLQLLSSVACCIGFLLEIALLGKGHSNFSTIITFKIMTNLKKTVIVLIIS